MRRWRWRRENNKIVEEERSEDRGGKIIKIANEEDKKEWGGDGERLILWRGNKKLRREINKTVEEEENKNEKGDG